MSQDISKQLVFTQFGPVPRDELVYIDVVEEHANAFTTNRNWYMKSKVKVIIGGEEREVDALLFARNDVNASVLYGQELGAIADIQP